MEFEVFKQTQLRKKGLQSKNQTFRILFIQTKNTLPKSY